VIWAIPAVTMRLSDIEFYDGVNFMSIKFQGGEPGALRLKQGWSTECRVAGSKSAGSLTPSIK